MLFFLKLHEIANLLFFTWDSTHCEDIDGIKTLVSSTHIIHAEAEAPPGIFNQHVLFK